MGFSFERDQAMSLLMDALKRAERAREAEEREGERPPPQSASSIPEFGLDPVDSDATGHGLALEPVPRDEEADLIEFTSTPLLENTATGLELSRLPEDGAESGGGTNRSSFQLDGADAEDFSGEREDSLEAELPPVVPGADAIEVSAIEVEDTSVALPSLELARAPVDSYFDGTDAVIISAIQTGEPEPSCGQTATAIDGLRLGEDTETQPMARRVFDAKAQPSSGRVARTFVFIVLPLLSVIGAVGGVLFWVSTASAPAVAARDGSPQTLLEAVLALLGPVPPQSFTTPRSRAPVTPTPTDIASQSTGRGVPASAVPEPAVVYADPGSVDTTTIAAVSAGTQQKPTDAGRVRRAEPVQRVKDALAQGSAAIAARGADTQLMSGRPMPEQGDLSVQPLPPEVIEVPPATPAAVDLEAHSDYTGEQIATAAPARRGSNARARAAHRGPLVTNRSAPSTAVQGGPESGRAEDERSSGRRSGRFAPGAFGSATARAQARLPQGPSASGTIGITRRPAVDRVSPVLTSAYSAYERGELARAAHAYKKILSIHPHQRDALLGSAAVAARQGRLGAARAAYAKLLALNPKDSTARSALLTLSPSADVQATESEFKLMLAEEPDAAHLYYSLGNLYASQGRWPEAQAAYFGALRHDASHPDYAFNLAVSLDHMRQEAAASDYYKRALRLAGTRDAGFDTAVAQLRVSAMAGGN
ncbi:MAG: tetratricopeptide repeat protein [Gammaproteobacteria bacterium]|nr:tetratricopeptide repeat protein [Gammaproteobacteria bacterium]